MNLLVTALYDEAKPFIEATGCKRGSMTENLNFYQGEGILVLIAGSGKVTAAVSLARLLERLDLENLGHVINVGTCGASDTNLPLGKVYLIHKITDESTGRNHFPDRLFSASFEEASLITVDTGKTKENSQKDSLYDMEGSGIFQAATQFLTTDRVHFLKVVSDHLEPETLTREKVHGWMKSSVPTVLEFVKSLPKLEKLKPLDQAEMDWLEGVRQDWNLTETQIHQLKDATIFFRLNNADQYSLDNLVQLSNNHSPEVSNKLARNQAFANLLNALGT